MCARRRRAASLLPAAVQGAEGTPLWRQECEEGDGAAASGMWGEWRRRISRCPRFARSSEGRGAGLGRRAVRLGAGPRVEERPTVCGAAVRPGLRRAPRPSGRWKGPRIQRAEQEAAPRSRPEKYEQLTDVSHILPILLSCAATVSSAGRDKLALGRSTAAAHPRTLGTTARLWHLRPQHLADLTPRPQPRPGPATTLHWFRVAPPALLGRRLVLGVAAGWRLVSKSGHWAQAPKARRGRQQASG